MKKNINNQEGFTLLELLISLVIISILSFTVMTMYINITKSYLVNGDKNEILYLKQRIMNTISKDIVYGTEVQVLDSDNNPIESNGQRMKLAVPDENEDTGFREVIYSFEDENISRNSNKIIENVSDVEFKIKKDENDINKYVEISGKLTGKTNDVDIDFTYIFDIYNKKWDFDYYQN